MSLAINYQGKRQPLAGVAEAGGHAQGCGGRNHDRIADWHRADELLDLIWAVDGNANELHVLVPQPQLRV